MTRTRRRSKSFIVKSTSSKGDESSSQHRARAASMDYSVASYSSSSALANGTTFPKKLAEMLEYEPEVLQWSEHGLSFFIGDTDALTNKLLPKYFRRK